jgi:hypothetical protein
MCYFSSPFQSVASIPGRSALKGNWQLGSGELPNFPPLTTRHPTAQRMKSMFKGVDLQCPSLESQMLAPAHCLNIQHESKPFGPVSFDLIKLQIPVPEPILTRRAVEYSHGSQPKKILPPRISHPRLWPKKESGRRGNTTLQRRQWAPH